MTTYLGIYGESGAGFGRARIVSALPAAGTAVGQRLIYDSDWHVYEWNGSTWTDLGAAVPTGGGGGLSNGDYGDVTVSGGGTTITIDAGAVTNAKLATPTTMIETSVPFTDGDTVRRVTVTNAALTATSKIVPGVTRPNTADSADVGVAFLPTVVSRGSGTCDVLILCIGLGQDDPVGLVNETVTLTLAVVG